MVVYGYDVLDVLLACVRFILKLVKLQPQRRNEDMVHRSWKLQREI